MQLTSSALVDHYRECSQEANLLSQLEGGGRRPVSEVLQALAEGAL